MSIKISVKRFVELLQKSKLTTDSTLKESLLRCREENGGRPLADLGFVIDCLIKDDVITQWQADKLLKEKYRGFYIGKYKLLGHLGTGGMSTVYLAEHNIMRQRRAIKVLPRKRVADKTYLERFYLEARAIAALNHPNIVRAYDIDQDGDVHFIVMEYVDGLELSDMVKEQGPLDFKDAARFVAEAADGLQHAHQLGLVHRDIKPANLLLDRHSDTVKVLDLGLALFKEEDYSLTVAFNEKVLGTADYLAPEQARDSHEVDYRADIYGLGCTLYYMLTGNPPFAEGSLTQRILYHQTREPKSISEYRKDVPKGLLAICRSMMQKDPEERMQTCGEVAEAMRAWLDGKPIPHIAQKQQVEKQTAGANQGGRNQSGERTQSGKGGNPRGESPEEFFKNIDTALNDGDEVSSQKPSPVIRGSDFQRKYNPRKENTPQSETESVKGSSDETFPSIDAAGERRSGSDRRSISGVLSSGDTGRQSEFNSSDRISLSSDSLKDLIASSSGRLGQYQVSDRKSKPIPVWVWVVTASTISTLLTIIVMVVIMSFMK